MGRRARLETTLTARSRVGKVQVVGWIVGWGLGLLVAGASGCEADRRQTEIEAFHGEFEQVRFDVGAGRVEVFGSVRTGTIWLEKWVGEGAGLGPIRAEAIEDRFLVEAPCNGGGKCHVEFDLTMPAATPLEIRMGRGRVELFRTGEEVLVAVDKGNVVGRELTSAEVFVEVAEGDVDLRFTTRPELVDVKVDRGNIRLHLPRFRYVCDFDVDAGHVEIHDLYCHRLVDQVLRLATGDGQIEITLFDPPPRQR